MRTETKIKILLALLVAGLLWAYLSHLISAYEEDQKRPYQARIDENNVIIKDHQNRELRLTRQPKE